MMGFSRVVVVRGRRGFLQIGNMGFRGRRGEIVMMMMGIKGRSCLNRRNEERWGDLVTS